jgi:hypothetical protein
VDSKGKGADSEAADSKGVAAASGVDSGGAVESAEMAGGSAMGFRVLKIQGAELKNNRCRVYLESTPVV